MTERSVRWGRVCRLATVTTVGVITVPVLLAGTALAGASPQTGPDSKGKIGVLKDKWGDARADAASKDPVGVYRAERDPGSLFTVTQAVGARGVWTQEDPVGRALTGQGVTVALLDSGIAPVPGLTAPGAVVHGPDLSLETANDALRNLDTFGHGTHLAGIIAGRDAVERDSRSGQPKGATPEDQLGIAPDAGLLSLKLATANGSTDVSQIIAALDWVSQHAGDNGMNVRVVNLSFGTQSLQPYQLDPLAAAAEHAWRRGLVVVVSGGNDGNAAGRLSDPAIDPYVLAVGASDPQVRVKGWQNPAVASFSNGGSADRHVDVLAPGTSITALRDPGSFVDTVHPEGLVAGDDSGRLFRGSGTSQAAAVVSGAAALLLQANPALTPDQVKAALVTTADPLPGVSPRLQGAGQIDVAAAVKAVKKLRKAGPAAVAAAAASAAQRFPSASGTGSLEAARGGSNLVDPMNGVVLTGEIDLHGQPFDAAGWAAASAAGLAWSGGTWNGAGWSGDGWESAPGWSGSRWSGGGWDGSRWSGSRWSDAGWDGSRWSGSRWSDAGWDGSRWSGSRWSDAGWDGSLWSGALWSGSGPEAVRLAQDARD